MSMNSLDLMLFHRVRAWKDRSKKLNNLVKPLNKKIIKVLRKKLNSPKILRSEKQGNLWWTFKVDLWKKYRNWSQLRLLVQLKLSKVAFPSPVDFSMPKASKSLLQPIRLYQIMYTMRTVKLSIWIRRRQLLNLSIDLWKKVKSPTSIKL